MASLSEQMTPWSRILFTIWRVLRLKRDFTGRLAGGPRLCLRAPPASDVEAAEQVFGAERYRPPRPLPGAARIVDGDAGCGFATLYWLRSFPDAVVTAFEPHPDKVDAFVENADLNAFWDRVLLHPNEADTADGDAKLEGTEGFGSIFKKGGASRFQNVKRVDFFQRVGDAPIALLKLRARGAEQPILADERFARLKVGQLVLDGLTPEARAWCERRLAALGYRTEAATGEGLLWAAYPSP